jgi:hypothetical protein
MKYHQYLKDNQLGNSLGKEKLQLRIDQHLEISRCSMMLWWRFPELSNFALACSTWKVKMDLAFKSANPTCRMEIKKNHTSQIESTLLVHELKQGPLKLKLLVVLWPTYSRSAFPTPNKWMQLLLHKTNWQPLLTSQQHIMSPMST